MGTGKRQCGRAGAAVALLLGILAACGTEEPEAPEGPPPDAFEPTPEATPDDPGAPEGPAAADGEGDFNAEEYFGGQTMRLVIPNAPGGGVDAQSRYFAANWGEFIPGNPEIIASNVTPPMAGSNFLHNSAPDGLTFYFGGSLLFLEQFDDEAEFRIPDFSFLGAISTYGNLWMVRGEVPHDDITEAQGSDFELTYPIDPNPLTMSATTHFSGLLLAEAFDLNVRPIPMSDATSGSVLMLALERGDVNGYIRAGQYWQPPHQRPGWAADGFVKPFAFIGPEGDEMQPNAESPAVATNVTDHLEGESRGLYDAFVMPNVFLNRVLMAPPDVPDEVLATLRQAYLDAMDDPEFRGGFQQLLGQDITKVWDGEELQAFVQETSQSVEDDIETYRSLAVELHERYTGQ